MIRQDDLENDKHKNTDSTVNVRASARAMRGEGGRVNCLDEHLWFQH